MDVVGHLVVHEDRMLANLNMSKGSVFSGRLLVRLIDKGLTRNEAYDKIQKCAFSAKKDAVEFKDAILHDDGIRSVLSAAEIEEIFNVRYYVRNVDKIFRRVGI